MTYLDEVEEDGHGHDDNAEEGDNRDDQDNRSDEVGEGVQPLRKYLTSKCYSDYTERYSLALFIDAHTITNGERKKISKERKKERKNVLNLLMIPTHICLHTRI